MCTYSVVLCMIHIKELREPLVVEMLSRNCQHIVCASLGTLCYRVQLSCVIRYIIIVYYAVPMRQSSPSPLSGHCPTSAQPKNVGSSLSGKCLHQWAGHQCCVCVCVHVCV